MGLQQRCLKDLMLIQPLKQDEVSKGNLLHHNSKALRETKLQLTHV